MEEVAYMYNTQHENKKKIFEHSQQLAREDITDIIQVQHPGVNCIFNRT